MYSFLDKVILDVFISHSWSYSEHYDRLAEWIFSDFWAIKGQTISFRDTSVPRNDPIHCTQDDSLLKSAIYERIIESDVIVIPAAMYVNHSEWIKKEIDGAKHYKKPILAVKPWGQEKLSSRVTEVADKVVGWGKENIINSVCLLGLEY